jgi:hypothetical protein
VTSGSLAWHLSQGHAKTNRAAVLLHEQGVAIQMQLLPKSSNVKSQGSRERPDSRITEARSYDLEDDFHHSRRADREALNTVHHPRMTAFSAEDLAEQIGCTISNRGVLNEFLCRH